MHENFCKIYSIPEGMKEIGNYGRIGNGPGEFLQPFYTYTNENRFGLNEINKQELAIMELTSNAKIKEIKRMRAPYKPKHGELNLPDYHFIELDDSHFVSLLCDSKNGFFTLFDNNLNPITRFGESPIEEELPPYTSRTRLKGQIAAKNGTMVFATSYLPYLACYQLQSGTMQKQWDFFFDKTFYSVQNGDLLFSKEKSFGQILSLCMDEQYIYVLYLDQLLSEYDYSQPDKCSSNKILIFDYKGNDVAKLTLDCRIEKMAISRQLKKIFGLGQLPEPMLVEFDLPL